MSDSRGPSREQVARLLRQRVEMGGGEVFLEDMTRAQALEYVADGVQRLGTASPAPVPSPDIVDPPSSPRPKKEAGGAVGVAARAPVESTASLVLPDDYDEVRALALACTRCGLAAGRTQVVFSDGPPDARLMVVGEAPGANEDASGVPFVGMAGQYLDLLLATVGLSRKESVYIANVLKCRPPGNRDPRPEEIEACSPFLRKQIDLVKPRALLAVGSFSARLLTGRDGMALGKLRGEVHTYHGVPLVVTYHPAALLRNRRWTRSFWDDLQLLRTVIDRG